MDMSPTDKLKAREGDHGQGDRLNQKKYFSPIRNASVSESLRYETQFCPHSWTSIR